MSLIKIVQAQFGQQTEAVKNFTWTAEDADGSIQLKRGVPGAYTETILEVKADGSVHFKSGASAVGPVTQTGGVPTGAIIESGSNANGNYTKFADGTMICTYTESALHASGLTSTGLYFSNISWTFPATFIAAPNVSGSTGRADGLSLMATVAGIGDTSINSSHVIMYITSAGAFNTVHNTSLMAIGRWY